MIFQSKISLNSVRKYRILSLSYTNYLQKKRKHFHRFFFLFFLSLFFQNLEAQEVWNYRNKNYQVYQTEGWSLVSDLPKDFSLPILEYSENFTHLVYEFLADIREESPKLNGKLFIFSNCREYESFLKDANIKSSPLFFKRISQESWNQFTIAGCFTNSKHLFRSLQNELSSALLKSKNKPLPPFLVQGLSDYFTYSQFIADDLSIVPYSNQSYVIRLKKLFSESKLVKLEDLFLLEQKEFTKNKHINFPHSWILISFLMDRYPNGRTILKEYSKEYFQESDPSKKAKIAFYNTFRNLRRANIQDFDKFNKAFSDYLEYLDFPPGYSKYTKAKEYTTFSSKIEILNQAIQQNSSNSVYYSAIARVYFQEPMYEKSLEYSEKALEMNLLNKEGLRFAIRTSYKLNQFSKTLFFLEIAQWLKIKDQEILEISEQISRWRKSNPEIPIYKPELNFFQN